jgi:hypothetical protein
VSFKPRSRQKRRLELPDQKESTFEVEETKNNSKSEPEQLSPNDQIVSPSSSEQENTEGDDDVRSMSTEDENDELNYFSIEEISSDEEENNDTIGRILAAKTQIVRILVPVTS